MARLEKFRGQMRSGQRDQHDDHDDGGQRQRHGERAGMLRPEPINEPEKEQHDDRRDRDVILQKLQPHDLLRAVGHIGQRRPAAQRRGHGQVRDQEQGADDREQSALRARRGIDAASIREIAADNRVVYSHQSRQRADRENDWQR